MRGSAPAPPASPLNACGVCGRWLGPAARPKTCSLFFPLAVTSPSAAGIAGPTDGGCFPALPDRQLCSHRCHVSPGPPGQRPRGSAYGVSAGSATMKREALLFSPALPVNSLSMWSLSNWTNVPGGGVRPRARAGGLSFFAAEWPEDSGSPLLCLTETSESPPSAGATHLEKAVNREGEP